MANSICVLNYWEAEELEIRQIIPSCRNHKHIKKVEAMEWTGVGDNTPYFKPIACWVGPGMKHLRMLTVWTIVRRESGRAPIPYGPKFSTQQLVEQGVR